MSSGVQTRATTAQATAANQPPNQGQPGGGPPGGGGGGGGGTGGGQVQPQAPNAIQFALAPAMINSNTVIDYSTPDGIKLFETATHGLYKETSDMFDCTPDGLEDFLQRVKDRSQMMAYHEIYQITDNSSNPGVNRDFLNNYGALTMEDIRANVLTYINAPSRRAQESFQLYQALMNSLSVSGRAKVTIWADEYTINGIPSGVLLLKKIIQVSTIDTNATAAFIRTQLSSLDEYMGTIGSDITKFNQHVRSLVLQLQKRRETSNDLLTNLFKGYLACDDRKFVEYIEKKLETYEEGEHMDPNHLMALAENKYKIRVQSGEWKAPSEEQTKILALEAKIKSLETKHRDKKSDKKGSKKGSNSNRKSDGKKKGSKQKKNKPKWMTTPPTGEQNTKTVDGKTYNWCQYHEAWVLHTPDECRLKNDKKGKMKSDENANNANNESA